MNLPNAAERTRLIQAAERTLAHLKALPELTPCTQCAEFRDGYCARWKANVPPDAQEAGCVEWFEVPF